MEDTAEKVYNPQGWPQSRLKDYVELNPSVAVVIGEEVSYMPMECLRYDSIEQRTKVFDNDASLTTFENGDIVMAKVTPCFENGNIAIAQNLHNGKGIGSSELFVLRAKGINTRYLFYYILTPHVRNRGISSMSGTGGLKRINSRYFMDSILLLPPESEQTRITNFLDRKCADIDNILEKTKASIEKYKKLKQSVITEAVTKGVRGERQMKDSGIEWIGEIPEEWKISRIKEVASLKTGTTPKNYDLFSEEDVQIDWFTPSDISSDGNILFSSERRLSSKVIEEERITLFPKKSVFFVGIGALAGKVGYTEVDGYSNQQITAIISQKEYSGKFLFYQMIPFQKVIRDNAFYTTLPIINNGYLSCVRIVNPPLFEQQEITDYLDTKCAKIDNLISSKEKFITELESYKKSLIYEYVTGKKEVPNTI